MEDASLLSERLETPNRKTHWSNPIGFINIKRFTGRRSSLHQTLEKSVGLKIPPCPPFFASWGKHLFSGPFSSPTQFLGHPPISSRIHWNDLQSTHPAEGRALQHCLSSFMCGFFYWQHLPLKSLPACLKISTVLPLPYVMGFDLHRYP